MASHEPTPPTLLSTSLTGERRSGSRRWVIGSLLAAMLASAATYVVVAREPSGPPPASVVVVKPTPNVLVAVRSLARLETMEFHMERVVDLTEKQRHLFGLVEAEDSLLLVAAGDVTAGVDLGELRPDDVSADLDTKTARVRLPAPRVFATRLDSEHTYVHSRRTDTLARRQEGLETRARQEAEKRIGEAAAEAGILKKAREPAERTVEQLLRSLGFEQVTIEWREA